MTEEQARTIHRAARALVMHHRAGDLHPIDYQRFRRAMFGNQRVYNGSLLRAAYTSIGQEMNRK